MKFEVLEDEDIRQITEAAFDILQRTGIEVYDDDLLELMKGAGASVKGELVKLPVELVKNSLEQAPRDLTIYSRGGAPQLALDLATPYFGNGSDVVYIEDPITQERRKFTEDDVRNYILVCDALDQIDFVMPPGIISNLEAEQAGVRAFLATLLNTGKPIMFTALNRTVTEEIFKIASLAVGGQDVLSTKPYIMHYVETTSPLSLSKDAAQMLLFSADHEVPVVCAPGPIGGATAPVTLSGVLALHVAESLFELTAVQIVNPGAPSIFGGCASIIDMQTAVSAYGGPEFVLLNSALTEIAHYFNLPMFGTAGCSDSKRADNQAAIESSFSAFSQGLSSADLIHDVGYVDSGMTNSYIQLVMSNEIISFFRRVGKGIRVDSDHIGLDLINNVGPKGNYLTQQHTLKYFKEENWTPQFITRKNYETWLEDGAPDYRERVVKYIQALLNEHEPPPLDDNKKKEIMNGIPAKYTD